MALENVVDGIRAQARSEADAQAAKARAEAEALLAAAREKAAKFREQRSRELADEIVRVSRRERAAAELESRRLKLEAEKALLAALRAAAETRLRELPPEVRARHVKQLAARAGIPGGRLVVSEKDRAAAEKLGGPVTTGAFLGGVVVDAPDGSTREDLRYESLLDEIWQANLKDVVSVLLEK
ncbi:MAG TPA: hypothetical protein VM681_09390 [Candidatus Thermoplasmatota archaeon]|nr:hypothetical protein [Candidatus Thermoplasmatota archaeon]